MKEISSNKNNKLSALSFIVFYFSLLFTGNAFSNSDLNGVSLEDQIIKIEDLYSSSPQKAFALAKKLNQEYPNEKEVMVWLSRLYSQFSDPDQTYHFASNATEFKLTPAEQTHVQMALAYYYQFNVDRSNTEKHLRLAVKAAYLTKSASDIVRALAFRATIYVGNNRLHQAMDDISAAYEYIDDVTDTLVLSDFYNALCSVYVSSKQFDGAIEAQLKSIEYMLPTNNKQQLSVLYYNLADIYWKTEFYQKALVSYTQSLKFSRESGDTAGESYAYMGQGKSQLSLENYSAALIPLLQAESFFDEERDTINIVETNSHLAQVYLNLKRFPEAKARLNKIRNYPNYIAESESPTLLRTQLTLAELLYAEGNYNEAFKEQQTYIQSLKHHHKDDLKASEQTAFEKLSNSITAKENEVLKLENELKSKELEEEKRHSKSMLIVVIFCTVVTVFVTILLRKNLKLRRELNVLATTDELTQLYNRRKIMSILSRIFKQFKQRDSALHVAIFDLDLFKSINDTYGHNMGDEVLKAVSKCAQEVIGEVNYVGRYGGEEFLIVMSEGDYQSNYVMLEHLRRSVAEIKIDGLTKSISISIGLSEASQQDKFQTDIIHRADKALYEAKIAGRNQLKGA